MYLRPDRKLIVTMKGWILLLMLAKLVDFSMTQPTNSLTWLSYLRNRAYSHGYGRSHNNIHASLSAEDEDEPPVLDCPLECDLPSFLPQRDVLQQPQAAARPVCPISYRVCVPAK